MATTFTPSIKLGKPAVSDTGWGPVLTAGSDTLDALAPVGGLAVTTHEQPSATLLVDVAAGKFTDQAGGVQTYAGVASQAIALSTTKTLYLDGTSSGARVGGAAYPATAHVRLASVVAGATTIASITDNRQCFGVAGSIAEGVNLALGTATGTQIGTATSQKLAFFGSTAIVQPGAAVDVVTALTNLGLLASGTHPATLGATTVTTLGTAGTITLADGNNVVVGTSAGTKIGTATSQKIGFYNATPVIQPTMGAGTAGATYTATEQAMLNAVYSAVRALGLGS